MARKSRKETVITAEPVPSLYVHVALYIRLSVEDNKKRGCSVENQKLVLNDFLADKPDFVVYDTYIDNGMTGTNFHRPGFQQMLSDIEAGYINCVIVKDLSRLGRNSIDTGYYIEQYFYTHNVRFIAVTDQFDTADPGNLHGGIMLPLKNMINEAYSLDIGRKIKAQARQAMKDGDYIGARAPYGYRKDPENCHKLLIDEAAAPVVQQIFQWAYERVALNRIVRNLNEMGIPAPSHYKKTTGEITSPGLIGSGKWQTRTVMKILESEVYTGDLVQGKTKIVDHQQVQAGDDNLIVARHTHEPIISHAVFEAVQDYRKQVCEQSKAVPKKPYTPNIFKGKVFCADCGRSLHRQRAERKKGPDIYWFHCLTDSNLNHTGIYLYSKGKIMIHLTFDYKTDEKCTTPGQYLKYHRTFQGLSTRELAEKVGIVPATLVLYENDRHPIKYSTAVALANVLGIDRNRLLDEYTAFVDYPYFSLLKKVRQDLSLTQIQMAELIGIGQTSYSGWEREIRVPRRKEYDKILAALKKLRVNVDTYLCQSASI